MDFQINLPKPHPGQQQVLDSKARFKVLLCGRRWGKTLVAQIIAIDAMLNRKKVAYVVPEFSLAKDFFNQILDLLPQDLIKTQNKSDFQIDLITGGSLKFFSGENLDSVRGRRYHCIVIDEAAKIADLQTAWATAIRPTLTDFKGNALFISTPKGTNAFYALFLKGKEKVGGFESFHFTSYDNPFLSKDELDAMKQDLNEAQFKEEILAEPMADGNNPFGIENIQKNIITELSAEPTIVYGIDIASHVDFTVITGLDINGHMTYFDRFQLPWEVTFSRIKALPENVMKVVDSTGVGDVMFERLQSTTQNIHGFKFTNSSKPAIINQLINDVQKGDIKYNQKTADEMSVFTQVRTSTGYIKYEAQKGYHDDAVMALGIANHYRYQAWANTNWQLYSI